MPQPPRILIASPTYNGQVQVEYMRMVMNLTDWFRQNGIAWDMFIESATQLHVMRSVMASRALLDGFSHVLFLDTDNACAPSAIPRLLAANKAVIGCASPYRTIPYHEPVTASGQTLRQVLGTTLPYTVWFPPGTEKIDVVDGICEVEAISTGILLIRRETLQTMADNGTARRFRAHFPYTQWYSHPEYFGFFEHRVVNGGYLSEDISFCRGWRDLCGGQVHALVDEEIMHVGPVPVVGRYFDKLKAGKI